MHRRVFPAELPRIGPRVEDVGEVPPQGHNFFIIVSVLDVRNQALQRAELLLRATK